MKHLTNIKAATGLVGAVLLAACTPLAQGALQISYDETSPTPTAAAICGVGPDAGPVTCAATPPGATISVLSANSNSPGTPGLAEQFGSSLFIATTEAVTVHIWFAAQDFTAPTTPPPINYESSLEVTSTTGTGSVSLESCVDTSNGLAPPTGAFCSGVGSPTLNNPAEDYSGSTITGTTIPDVVSETITSLSGTYSLSQELTLMLGANSHLNIITSQSLTPVPEPASLALLGSSLLGAGLLFRRKIQAKRG